MYATILLVENVIIIIIRKRILGSSSFPKYIAKQNLICRDLKSIIIPPNNLKHRKIANCYLWFTLTV